MSTAGQARLQTGLNGPVSGMSQLVRRFAAASMDAPRGSNGASGPQYGGLSIASTSKRHSTHRNTADRLVGKIRQLRNEVTHRNARKRSRKTHHRRQTMHARQKRSATARRHMKPIDDKRKFKENETSTKN